MKPYLITVIECRSSSIGYAPDYSPWVVKISILKKKIYERVHLLVSALSLASYSYTAGEQRYHMWYNIINLHSRLKSTTPVTRLTNTLFTSIVACYIDVIMRR